MSGGEMVERVARAIGDAARARHGGTLMAWAVSPERQDCLAFAEAAIAALRAPTEAMIRAAGYSGPLDIPAWMEAHDWPRMIDEALK